MAPRRPDALVIPPPELGPVRLTDGSRVAFEPATGASISGGFWAERRQVNRDVTVPSTWDQLHEAGNFINLDVAAGRQSGTYVQVVAFFDSDVYKWLEAVGWTPGGSPAGRRGSRAPGRLCRPNLHDAVQSSSRRRLPQLLLSGALSGEAVCRPA